MRIFLTGFLTGTLIGILATFTWALWPILF